MDAQDLAKLAITRVRLERAISTAQSCGDYEYVRKNRPNLTLLDEEIDQALASLPKEVIDEAREITNAPI